MTINRIGMGFGLLKAKMEVSLPVSRMGSVKNTRPVSASSKYEYSFLSRKHHQIWLIRKRIFVKCLSKQL